MMSNGKVRRIFRGVLDRLGGPVLSVALNVLVVGVLLRAVVFREPEAVREVQVQMVQTEVPETPPADLQQPDQLPQDESLTAADETAEAPPDAMTAPPDASMPDLSGLSCRDVQSPLTLQGLFAGRTEAARAAQLKKFAGGYGDQVAAAVLRALRWLASQQQPAGCWGRSDPEQAVWHTLRKGVPVVNEQRATRLTALCLLAFLAHGETPQSAEFGPVVQRAMEYLLAQQHPQSGMFVPLAAYRPEKSGEDLGVYAHAQAVYALAEAYALTCAPALKEPVGRGIEVIARGQLAGGAWGNWYEQDIADASATSWQIQALKAAEAAGIRTEGLERALQQAAAGIAGLYKGDGCWYYRKGAALSMPREGGPVMSGAMVLSLQLLGRSADPMVLEGLRYINRFGVTEWERAWENPINKSLPATYEWYYNTQAVFQRGGSRWTAWNSQFAPMLLAHQAPEGWWMGIGQSPGEEQIYSTALCALSLQVYYRILPGFQRAEVRPPQVVFEDDVRIRIL